MVAVPGRHVVRAVRHTGVVDISARTEYAVRAMLSLAQAQDAGAGPISVDTLAHRQDLPRRFLEAIVADLRGAGLVESTRGARGGYTLVRPASAVTLGDVFRAVDGPLAEVRGLRPHETSYDGVAQHLPTVWVAVRGALRGVLDGTSLADVLTGDLPPLVREIADAPDAWRNR
jgi:Rrf2 family protein